ncbi:Conserved_hypothetical protein [Hexamita inflata]|uniref:Uncharacterized protein n=1 Tax=Hexamita inflata TaxID=28002 RepID=A0AA86Q3C1_9EUKA|nr:Conserved hypothetical protein [Hexamita inflata]
MSLNSEYKKLVLELQSVNYVNYDQKTAKSLLTQIDQFDLSSKFLLQIIRYLQFTMFPTYTTYLSNQGLQSDASDSQCVSSLYATLQDALQYSPRISPDSFTDQISLSTRELTKIQYHRIRTVRIYTKLLRQLKQKWIRISSTSLRKNEGFVVLLPNANQKPGTNLVDLTKKAVRGKDVAVVGFKELPEDVQVRIENQFNVKYIKDKEKKDKEKKYKEKEKKQKKQESESEISSSDSESESDQKPRKKQHKQHIQESDSESDHKPTKSKSERRSLHSISDYDSHSQKRPHFNNDNDEELLKNYLNKDLKQTGGMTELEIMSRYNKTVDETPQFNSNSNSKSNYVPNTNTMKLNSLINENYLSNPEQEHNQRIMNLIQSQKIKDDIIPVQNIASKYQTNFAPAPTEFQTQNFTIEKNVPYTELIQQQAQKDIQQQQIQQQQNQQQQQIQQEIQQQQIQQAIQQQIQQPVTSQPIIRQSQQIKKQYEEELPPRSTNASKTVSFDKPTENVVQSASNFVQDSYHPVQALQSVNDSIPPMYAQATQQPNVNQNNFQLTVENQNKNEYKDNYLQTPNPQYEVVPPPPVDGQKDNTFSYPTNLFVPEPSNMQKPSTIEKISNLNQLPSQNNNSILVAKEPSIQIQTHQQHDSFHDAQSMSKELMQSHPEVDLRNTSHTSQKEIEEQIIKNKMLIESFASKSESLIPVSNQMSNQSSFSPSNKSLEQNSNISHHDELPYSVVPPPLQQQIVPVQVSKSDTLQSSAQSNEIQRKEYSEMISQANPVNTDYLKASMSRDMTPKIPKAEKYQNSVLAQTPMNQPVVQQNMQQLPPINNQFDQNTSTQQNIQPTQIVYQDVNPQQAPKIQLPPSLQEQFSQSAYSNSYNYVQPDNAYSQLHYGANMRPYSTSDYVPVQAHISQPEYRPTQQQLNAQMQKIQNNPLQFMPTTNQLLQNDPAQWKLDAEVAKQNDYRQQIAPNQIPINYLQFQPPQQNVFNPAMQQNFVVNDMQPEVVLEHPSVSSSTIQTGLSSKSTSSSQPSTSSTSQRLKQYPPKPVKLQSVNSTNLPKSSLTQSQLKSKSVSNSKQSEVMGSVSKVLTESANILNQLAREDKTETEFLYNKSESRDSKSKSVGTHKLNELMSRGKMLLNEMSKISCGFSERDFTYEGQRRSSLESTEEK